MKALLFFLLILCALPLSVLANEAKQLSDDPELEKRVAKLSEELRCPICQSESLAGSNAELAADLRRQIREQVKAGKTDEEVVAFMTARYGDYIRYKPPLTWRTYLLWFGPFILLAGGLVAFYRYIKQRRELIVEEPLSAAERKRAEALLQTTSPREQV
jgi:cytochrome c-type biogenesis protein CcmH